MIPDIYNCLIEDLYKFSCFQLICGNDLSKLFFIIRGTKTGDPLSALLFILVIDMACKPMVEAASFQLGLENDRCFNPIPVQAFADDIALTSYNLNVIKDMISASELVMLQAGLEVKTEKCAVFYGRRSGNNWYEGKKDVPPAIIVQAQILPVLSRSVACKYLGKSLTLSGEDCDQIRDFTDTYKSLVDNIKNSELPLSLKCSAFNNLALAKILHHFYNSRISETVLESMEKHLVESVRELFGFYKSTTQLSIFFPREHGGLGIKKISNIYYTTRIAYLVKMLNHNVDKFKFIARRSVKLAMKRRKVSLTDSENNFLGYELNEGFLVCKTSYGCQSDWPDLVRYARKVNVRVKYHNDLAVIYSNGIILNSSQKLQKTLYNLCVKDDIKRAESMSIQGSFFRLTNINAKCSHSIFYNWKVNDDLIKFTMKARLSILPTNFTTYLWNRENNPRCPFGCNHTESIAHLLNGCLNTFGNFYSRRHNRVVEKISELLKECHNRYRIYNEKRSETIFPLLREQLITITNRKPDILGHGFLQAPSCLVICYLLIVIFISSTCNNNGILNIFGRIFGRSPK